MSNLVGGQMLAELVASQRSRQRRFAAKEQEFAESAVPRRKLTGRNWRRKSGHSRRKSGNLRNQRSAGLPAKGGNSRRKSGNSRNVALTRGLGCPRAETDRAEIDGEHKKFAATERKLAERDFDPIMLLAFGSGRPSTTKHLSVRQTKTWCC